MNVRQWNSQLKNEEIERRLSQRLGEHIGYISKGDITRLRKAYKIEVQNDFNELRSLQVNDKKTDKEGAAERVAKKKLEAQKIEEMKSREVKRCKHCQTALCEIDGDSLDSDYCARHI